MQSIIIIIIQSRVAGSLFKLMKTEAPSYIDCICLGLVSYLFIVAYQFLAWKNLKKEETLLAHK